MEGNYTLIYLAQFVGAVCFMLDVIGSMQKSKKEIVKYNYISNFLYGIEYLMLGAMSGMICSIIAIFRNYFFDKYKRKTRFLLFIYLFIIITFNIPNMKDIISIIPVINISLMGIALTRSEVGDIKIVLIITGMTSIAYNICTFAYVSAITSFVFTIGAYVSYMYYLRDKKSKDNYNFEHMQLDLI